MIWYGLSNGQLRTLRRMLEAPLEFDPVEFIERTFDEGDPRQTDETHALAKAYNDLRKQLLASLGEIYFGLNNTSKLNLDNFHKDSAPLVYECYSHPHDKFLEKALILKSCDGNNLHLDRILDSFKIKECVWSTPNAGVHQIIKLYFFSEVLFMLLTGTAIAIKQDGHVLISPSSPEVTKQLHRKWFANRWEQNSCIANIAYIDRIPKGADEYRWFPAAITMLGAGLADKVFFLPVENLPRKLDRSQSVQWIKKLCNLAVLCMWCQTKNDMAYAPNELIHKLDISREDIAKIRYYSDAQSEPDKVFAIRSRGISVGNPSITTQLRKTINFIANEVSEGALNKIVGDYFEKVCVIDFFANEEIGKNYRVYTGFVSGDVNDHSLRPDVDLIIKDLHRSKFFFTQVKYARIGGKAYISGDIDHLVSGPFHKGVQQLLDARTALLEGKLNDILSEKGLNECTADNSHFLLIHNVYNFDFTLWPQGIVSYEWNSLRNILNCGSIFYGLSNRPVSTWQHSGVLPLEDPDALIQHYVANAPDSVVSSIGTIFEADNLVVRTDLGGTQIQCQGLGL
ncbi:hypothetical protein [Pseudomonas sp. Pseu.R1]|uniref:hypothetical protein n=1 Tax=Pseudomonas sp. Pseu.R1 TaxID=3379818 RepID=UPI003B93A495